MPRRPRSLVLLTLPAALVAAQPAAAQPAAAQPAAQPAAAQPAAAQPAAQPAAAQPAAAQPAAAQPAAPVVLEETVIPARLEYTAAPGCFDEETFHHAVGSFMHKGRDPFDANAADVLRVTIKKVPGGYRGTLQKIPANSDPWPEDDWTGPTCEGVFREIARLASTLVLGPPKPAEPPPEPAPPADPIPPPEPPAPACPACPICGTARPPAPCPAPPKPPPWRMDLSVGVYTYAAMTAFFSANVGPAVAIGGDVRGEVFGMSAELRFAIPSVTYAREPVPGATSSYPVEFDLSQLTALFVPCARYKWFVACGVGQVGTLIMQSEISGTLAGTFAFGPRLGFEVPFAERFAFFGFGEVLFTPAPTSFNFILPDPAIPDGIIANTRWKQSVASGFFALGVQAKFQ